MLIDTHCHIHDEQYPTDIAGTLQRAKEADVSHMICVGTSESSSLLAVELAGVHDVLSSAIGVHPHDTKDGWTKISPLFDHVAASSIVAVGEIGLDYFYTHSPREIQIKALEEQIDLALRHDKPIIFHVREAFDDFWPIFDNFQGIRGELHSFTDTKTNLEEGLKRGLYIGVNGISTFTKDVEQQEMFNAVPLNRMLFETDAPFLTPAPFRGRINEPAFVAYVAEHHAKQRGIPTEEIASVTAANATALFAL